MTSPRLPEFYYTYGPNPPSDSTNRAGEKNSLPSLDIDILKTLTDKRKSRDGKPPKRRGPKPDSKPALTRRQELNRQAQRTHRERKELYTKALEEEVLRLKETCNSISIDRARLSKENSGLRAVLRQNGIAYGGTDGSRNSARLGYSPTTSNPGSSHLRDSYSPFTPPLTSHSPASSTTPSLQVPPSTESNPSTTVSPGSQHMQTMLAAPTGAAHGIDYEQAGIDFVLTPSLRLLEAGYTGPICELRVDYIKLRSYSPGDEYIGLGSLERPCMDHMPWLMESSAKTGAHLSGHALMASCPPGTIMDLAPDASLGFDEAKGGLGSEQRTWEPSKGDLASLLTLSMKLDLGGEITPVMAWGMILAHPRVGELGPDDLAWLTHGLSSRIRCYGFGAVMEEFEMRDALEHLFSAKSDAAS